MVHCQPAPIKSTHVFKKQQYHQACCRCHCGHAFAGVQVDGHRVEEAHFRGRLLKGVIEAHHMHTQDSGGALLLHLVYGRVTVVHYSDLQLETMMTTKQPEMQGARCSFLRDTRVKCL